MGNIFKKFAKYAGLTVLVSVLAACVFYTIGDIAYRTMFQPHQESTR